jgi:hypothetical protein
MCRVGIPESNPNEDDYAMLSTADLWQIINESGWKLEEDVPPHRKSLGYVPKFPELVEKHGAWLATKIRLVLDATPHGFPSAPLIVCPSEVGAIVFTDFLKAILGIDAIRIPREIIDAFRVSDESIMASIEEKKDLWYRQLSSTSVQRVIVMDEFNFSGVTRLGLHNLLGHFGKNVLFYFSIVDFDPDRTFLSGVSSYSFYSFDHLPEGWTHREKEECRYAVPGRPRIELQRSC